MGTSRPVGLAEQARLLAAGEVTSRQLVEESLAALARTESRGCHRWRHAPPVSPAGQARHTVLRVTDGRPWVAGAVLAGAETVA